MPMASINDISNPQLLFEVTQALENPVRQLYALNNEYYAFISSKHLFKFLRDNFQSKMFFLTNRNLTISQC